MPRAGRWLTAAGVSAFSSDLESKPTGRSLAAGLQPSLGWAGSVPGAPGESTLLSTSVLQDQRRVPALSTGKGPGATCGAVRPARESLRSPLKPLLPLHAFRRFTFSSIFLVIVHFKNPDSFLSKLKGKDILGSANRSGGGEGFR